MYQAGDRVLYGIHGVCCVKKAEERMLDGTRRLFLALEPEGQDGCQYLIPTHNAAAMAKLRPLLTKQALQLLLSSDQVRKSEWITDENRRKSTYRELIAGGDTAVLLQMIYSLCRHQIEQSQQGKKFHQCDENFLRDAEKLVAGEIAAVMDMDAASARSYLKSQLNKM